VPSAVPRWGTAIWRGLGRECPQCRKTKIFSGYLKVKPKCEVCAAPLGDMPADDTLVYDAMVYDAMVVVMHFLGLFVALMFAFNYVPGVVDRLYG
jgi:uncharacterized protein (DUF983 family)